MKTIKEVVKDAASLTDKIIAENPGVISVSFEYKDFPLDEIREYAKANNEEVKFHPHQSRFGFIIIPDQSSAYIHVESIEVKARLVYDEVEAASN